MLGTGYGCMGWGVVRIVPIKQDPKRAENKSYCLVAWKGISERNWFNGPKVRITDGSEEVGGRE